MNGTCQEAYDGGPCGIDFVCGRCYTCDRSYQICRPNLDLNDMHQGIDMRCTFGRHYCDLVSKACGLLGREFQSCHQDNDCDRPMRCIDHECRTPCRNDTECSSVPYAIFKYTFPVNQTLDDLFACDMSVYYCRNKSIMLREAQAKNQTRHNASDFHASHDRHEAHHAAEPTRQVTVEDNGRFRMIMNGIALMFMAVPVVVGLTLLVLFYLGKMKKKKKKRKQPPELVDASGATLVTVAPEPFEFAIEREDEATTVDSRSFVSSILD